MAEEITLTDSELDALKELGNIGTGHATTALAEMTGVRIGISVPNIDIVPINRIIGRIVDEDELVAGLFFELSGGTTGFMQILFKEASALALTDLLMGREIGSGTTLSGMDESALKEVGNILASAFSDAWAKLLGIILLPSPPAFAFDTAGAVTNHLLTTIGTTVDNAILFKTIFEGELGIFSGYFLLLPHPESLNNILTILGGQIDE
ncbi:MAG: chemotaxis protein CheC [Euryarchaeota archaeon]|nr:chemotaxis protein CheC [Euryarchaeota archaeon]